MNFAPASADRVLHDTWIFVHDDDIHLFYLAMQIGNNAHRLIGHAVSRDWLHWTEWPGIDLAGPPGSWDAGRVGTGHTFRGPDGRFYLAYTGRIDPQEDIGLAVSEDLRDWRKVSGSPVWPQAVTTPYETDSAARGVAPAWRDPYVFDLPDQGRFALLCAKRNTGPLAARACVALARIDDLQQWTTCEPLRTPPVFPTMEVPEIFPLDGRWWLTFNAHGGWGKRLDTVSRANVSGTFHLVANEPFGEWRLPEESLLIGSGEGRHDAVVARSVLWRGERLAYHHYTGSGESGSARALGLPKVVETAGDRLVLRPWRGLDALHVPARLSAWEAPATGPFSSGSWKTEQETVAGFCSQGAAATFASTSAADLDLSGELRLEGAERAGVAVGSALILLDAKRKQVSLSELRAGTFGPQLDPALDLVRRPVGNHHLRLLKRDRYLEVFLDGELVFSSVWKETGSQGRIAFVVEGGGATFRPTACHGLEPMAR